MIASSLYEYFTVHCQKSTPIPVLLAFSVLTNGKKLFTINTKSSPNNIDCLTGVRVITMLWIVYGHTVMQTKIAPVINKIDMQSWFTDFWSMVVGNATISVDTFFFISGLLVAWLGFKELDKTGGKLNFIMMYVHRYIRLTPPVAAVLLYKLSINRLIYSGPMRIDYIDKAQCTSENWWPVLLYIANYFVQEPRCFDVTWYLNVDFQLYILSPLLLIPMWKYGKKFAPILLLLSIGSNAWMMVNFYQNSYTGLLSGTNTNTWAKVYVPTHLRCSPWLVGLGFGYFMHVNRQKKSQISKIYQLLGWIACLAIFFAIVFGPYFTVDSEGNASMLEAALYEGWKRFSWAIALCWLTFACHFGIGGLINSFLSHPFWQPFGRVSFALYLIHLTVININFGTLRSEIFFSDYHMMLQLCGAFGISLTFAILVTLAFESPIFVLEKFIFGGKPKSDKKSLESNGLNQVVLDLSKTQNGKCRHFFRYFNAKDILYFSHLCKILIKNGRETSVSVKINNVQSIAVLNNVTVSSDFLWDSLRERFQNIKNDINFNSSLTFSSQKCIDHMLALLNHYPSPKVNRIFNSWGKLPSGIEYGNFYDTGNFDQCVKTSIKFNDEDLSVVDGKYCFAKIKPNDVYSLEKNIARLSPLPNDFEINIGICVPDSCSEEFLTSVFSQPNGSTNFTEISVSNCSNGKRPPMKIINYFGIFNVTHFFYFLIFTFCRAIFSLFAVFMILSSIYDACTTNNKKSPKSIFLAFSIFSNGKKIFAIDTTKSPKNIDCLTGIRVVSMIMIINFHTYLNTSFIPWINEIDNLPWSKTLWSMYIMNAGMGVDSFFFISGLLAAWSGLQKMDKTKGKLNIGMMYVHRYIRLTPVVAATILFVMSINEFIYTGPFRDIVLSKNQCNKNTWWPNLLYIQNYYHPDGLCNNETWYLAADFQLYVLSPLLLIPLWKWGTTFSPVLLILSLISVGQVMTVYISKQFTGLLNVSDENKWELTYIPTHARCPPWLVGLAVGYFMHKNRTKIFHIPKILQLILWVISLTLLFGSVFGPYFTENGRSSVLVTAFYGGWKHFAWGIALAWITFACHFGFGGILNTFLSHPFWQPLGRLTYSMYLTNMIVLGIHFGMMRTPVYFSDYNEILYCWSTFGMTLVAAIVMALAFEYPVLVLEKCLLRKKAVKKKTTEEELSAPA
ncbi:nose resistant to fluoxetine protein 6-like [Episyrphus balteatus]|uniref:nose resistant to fluoxetine protein 6-like n=1 Tax=Episyrphus balteatus TaxID=286459 RepID=UPI002486B9A0|nr:nose resistant to fluoxetine protein 6-like [Episyrphus balteatus]